jgi:hypothetical protein
VSFWKSIRVLILLAILLIIATDQWLTGSRLTSWEKPLWVTIYPVTGSPSAISDSDEVLPYVKNLNAESFVDIGVFLKQQARQYGKDLTNPVHVQIANPLNELPPALPKEGAYLKTAIWSLKMRWWTWRIGRKDGLPAPDVQMFVIYHSNKASKLPERSVGVQKGRYGLVNAYASRRSSSENRIVIAHELLHVLGATDKYDLMTGQPREDVGRASPTLNPLYPQRQAEIMAGRIAKSPSVAVMPRSLQECVIGGATALEIGWQ